MRESASSLSWRPINLDHSGQWLPFPRNRVDTSVFEDMCIEAVIRIDNRKKPVQLPKVGRKPRTVRKTLRQTTAKQHSIRPRQKQNPSRRHRDRAKLCITLMVFHKRKPLFYAT